MRFNWRRWFKRPVICAITILVVSSICYSVYAFVYRAKPVVFHSDNFACACTDWSPEVDGFTVFNPFRDRAPERDADSFLADLSHGRCPVNAAKEFIADACKDGRRQYPPMAWKLRFRRDEPHRVQLYFNFERFGDNPTHGMTGEGFVEMTDGENHWKAKSMDVIF
jgi:hypothetical protein